MNKRATGAGYEAQAARFLERSGMQIVAQNYRTRSGEIDLIARDGKYLVFVEVKFRANTKNGNALEAVDLRKQRTIIRTAQHYLLRYGYGMQTPCRFDVVGINGTEITHIKNAFWME